MPPPQALVVDDNLMFTMSIEAALRRLGYSVRILPDPGGAAETVVAAPADLILVSLTTATPTALELIRQLRAHPALAGARILAYTGHVNTAALHAAREAGADQAIPNSAILGHLERVLSASSGESEV